MTPESLLVLVISVLTSVVFLAGIVSLNSRRMKTLFIALHVLLLTANVSWLISREFGIAALDKAVLASTILVFPMTTVLILAFFHGPLFTGRVYLPLAIFLPSLGIIHLSGVEGWTSSNLYDHSAFAYYLVLCLAISLAESIAHWLKSSILHKEGYLLMLSLAILLATGPVYYQELKILNAGGLIGPNLGFPLFSSTVLMALLRADFPLVRLESKERLSRGASRFELETGRVHFATETRPKYLRSIFAEKVGNGRPGLLLTSQPSGRFQRKYRVKDAAFIEVSFRNGKHQINASDMSKIYFLIRDFVLIHKHSVVLVDAFSRLVCNNDLQSTKELISHARRLASRTGCTFIVPLSLVTGTERSLLIGTIDSVMEFPDVEKKVLEILDAHIGNLSRHLLRTYCKSKGTVLKDLTLEDIPDLAVWITSTLDTLGVYAGDNAILKNWKNESYRISLDLMSYYNSDLEEAQRLSTDPPVTTESLISQVVFGREKIPKTSVRELPHERTEREMREKLLYVFTKYFGEAGRFVLAREVKKLGKSLDKVSRADLTRLAERAQEAMMEFGEIVDIDSVRTDMRSRGCLMKDEIVGIAAEGV
ncbi:MAG: DUF835 domain-containing protein [Thermoplasmata archaeon]